MKNFVGVTSVDQYGGMQFRSELHNSPGGIEQCFLDIVAAVKPDRTDEILDALEGADIPASVVGKLTEPGTGVVVIDGDGRHPLVHPEIDPFWGKFEEYLGKQAERKS